MADIDPATATVEDLVRLPPMIKQEAQNDWDAIVTTPDIDRAGAERVLAEQRWFSYTPAGLQVFSSGGSSGVRGVYVWDWEQFVTLACLAWRWQARAERAAGLRPPPGATGRAGGRRAATRQHAVVRRRDRAVDGDRRDPGGGAVRPGADGRWRTRGRLISWATPR